MSSQICYLDAEDISDVANWDAKVIQCLQDYRDELKDSKCKDPISSSFFYFFCWCFCLFLIQDLLPGCRGY